MSKKFFTERAKYFTPLPIENQQFSNGFTREFFDDLQKRPKFGLKYPQQYDHTTKGVKTQESGLRISDRATMATDQILIRINLLPPPWSFVVSLMSFQSL